MRAVSPPSTHVSHGLLAAGSPRPGPVSQGRESSPGAKPAPFWELQMSSPRERRQLPSLPPLPALIGSSHCQHACVPTQLAEEKPGSEHCPHSQHVLGGHCTLGSSLSNFWENSACCLLRMEVSRGVPGCRFENTSSIGILERPWKGGSPRP